MTPLSRRPIFRLIGLAATAFGLVTILPPARPRPADHQKTEQRFPAFRQLSWAGISVRFRAVDFASAIVACLNEFASGSSALYAQEGQPPPDASSAPVPVSDPTP